jgi:hypothetical protein
MIYFIKNVVSGHFKIGFSDNPRKRLKELQTGSDNRLVLIKSIEGDKKLEASLHEQFSPYRLDGEWFSPSEDIMNFISGKTANTLEGKFFHTFKNKQVEWQGYVVSQPQEGYYLVQLFEWLVGEPSCKKLVPIDAMFDWDFYDTAEEMNFYFEMQYKYRMEEKKEHDDAT